MDVFCNATKTRVASGSVWLVVNRSEIVSSTKLPFSAEQQQQS